jgi:hypothetical protein
MPAVTDTPASVVEQTVDVWRSMSPAERLEMVAALNDSCERLAEAGVRLRYPDADDREVWLRVRALHLGRRLMVEAYGWDPDVEGW